MAEVFIPKSEIVDFPDLTRYKYKRFLYPYLILRRPKLHILINITTALWRQTLHLGKTYLRLYSL